MKRWIHIPLIVGLMGLWTFATAWEAKPAPEKSDTKKAGPVASVSKPDREIHWETDYDAALKKAKETKKPVMIDFYTDWCTWCKVLDKTVYTQPSAIDAADKMVPLKINATDHPDLAMKYKAEGFPYIVFLNPEGKVIYKIPGFKPGEEFIPDMQAVAAGMTPKQAVQELIKKGTDDPSKAQWIGMTLWDEHKLAEAAPWLEKAAAKLPDDKKLRVQRMLPSIYTELKDRDKAEAAIRNFKNNPKANKIEVANAELRLAYRFKDRKRMEAALDYAASTAKTERQQAEIKEIRGKLDQLFPEKTDAKASAGKPGKKSSVDKAGEATAAGDKKPAPDTQTATASTAGKTVEGGETAANKTADVASETTDGGMGPVEEK